MPKQDMLRMKELRQVMDALKQVMDGYSSGDLAPSPTWYHRFHRASLKLHALLGECVAINKEFLAIQILEVLKVGGPLNPDAVVSAFIGGKEDKEFAAAVRECIRWDLIDQGKVSVNLDWKLVPIKSA